MANETMYPAKASSTAAVILAGKVVFGATGAVDTALSNTPGFLVTRNDTGDYSITPDAKFAALLSCHMDALFLGGAGGDQQWQVQADYTTALGLLQVQFRDISGGALADPASGDAAFFTMVFSQSAADRGSTT